MKRLLIGVTLLGLVLCTTTVYAKRNGIKEQVHNTNCTDCHNYIDNNHNEICDNKENTSLNDLSYEEDQHHNHEQKRHQYHN